MFELTWSAKILSQIWRPRALKKITMIPSKTAAAIGHLQLHKQLHPHKYRRRRTNHRLLQGRLRVGRVRARHEELKSLIPTVLNLAAPRLFCPSQSSQTKRKNSFIRKIPSTRKLAKYLRCWKRVRMKPKWKCSTGRTSWYSKRRCRSWERIFW